MKMQAAGRAWPNQVRSTGGGGSASCELRGACGLCHSHAHPNLPARPHPSACPVLASCCCNRSPGWEIHTEYSPGLAGPSLAGRSGEGRCCFQHGLRQRAQGSCSTTGLGTAGLVPCPEDSLERTLIHPQGQPGGVGCKPGWPEREVPGTRESCYSRAPEVSGQVVGLKHSSAGRGVLALTHLGAAGGTQELQRRLQRP